MKVLNTIEYGWEAQITPGSSSAVLFTPSMSVFVPETTSRRFVNAIVQVYSRDSGNTATIFGSALNVDVFIDGVKTSGQTGSFVQQTGEHYGYFHMADFTTAFNTSFTQASHSVGFSTNFSGSSYCNVSHKLYLTYEFEDASTVTSIKTVRIPINSNTTTLGTTHTPIGDRSGSIPNLDTFLPEASKVYRNIFWEYWGRETGGSTAELQMITRLDNGTEISRGKLTQRANSDITYFNIQTASLSTYTTNTTHSLWARSNVAARFSTLSALMHVTYEYDYTGSTSVMNSVSLHGLYGPGYSFLGTTPSDSGSATLYTVKYFAPETSVSLKQSAYHLLFTAFQQANFYVSAGTQSFSTYIMTQGGAPGGDYSLMHRIDSQSISGAFGTLQSGENIFNIRYYSGTRVTHNNFAGTLYLNYTSDKLSGSLGRSTRSIFYLYTGSSADNRLATYVVNTHRHPSLPQSRYISGYQYKIISQFPQNAPTFISYFINYTGSQENGVGSLGGNGFFPLIATTIEGVSEYGPNYFTNTLDYKRYPLDDVRKINLDLTRSVLYTTTITGNPGIATSNHTGWVTFNTNEHLISGSLLNYTGPGHNIPINFYRSGSNDYLFTLNSVSGTFSGSWYDNVIPIYATSYSGSKFALSSLQVASSSNTFTLDFSSGSSISSGEKSFTFIT